MRRRTLIALAGAAAASAVTAAEPKKTQIYVLQQFYMKHGTQLARGHEFLAALSARMKDKGPVICLEATIAAHTPQLALITGHPSLADFQKDQSAVFKDNEILAAFDKWETGAEPPYEYAQQIILQAAPYSREVKGLDKTPKTPRVFELRVYHSPTWRQLAALHQRFAGPEIKIFHRSGVHPLFYSQTAIGPNMPNLTYLIPFDDLAAREKAWNAFSADEEWVKVRKESIDKDGQIANVIQVSLFKAAPYSPVQ